MVLFKELEMEGFKKYDHKKVYKFDEGLIGIFGKNESGKSTIGDAVSVSLFGLSNTTYKKADVVTWGKLSSKLRLDFETDILYRVERTLGNKSRAILKKQKNGHWEIIANTIKAVDSQIQDILGLDFKSFKNSIFIAQNDLNSLSSLSRYERQTIINRLSRYDELSKAESILKDNLKEMNSDLNIRKIEHENIEKIVTEKLEKYEELQGMLKDLLNKNKTLNEKKSNLEHIRYRIKIFIELKELNDIIGKIKDQNKIIDEKVREISRIEGMEYEKREVEGELEGLVHVNSDLKYNVERIREIVLDVGRLDSLRKEVKEYQSLIDEKVREISRIEGMEYEKREVEGELRKLDYINNDLRDKIVEIGNLKYELKNLNEVEKVRNKGKIEDLKKKINERGSLINDKNQDIKRIEEKESEKKKFEEEIKNLDHITQGLKRRIDELRDIITDIASLKIELKKLEKEKKVKGTLLKNENILRINYEKYKEFLDINAKLSSLKKDINLLEDDIVLKKDELGDLKGESGNLGEIEAKFEARNSRANIFIFTGLIALVLGVSLGFILNLTLIIISLIGLAPLYKGYIDKNFYKQKLNNIKDKREIFGQLKQLEVQMNNKEHDYDTYTKELNVFENLNLVSLKNDYESFENLNKEKIELGKLVNQENILKTQINKLEEGLSNKFQKMPSYYREMVSFDDENLDKEVLRIYQEEDKRKSNYETTVQELNKQIIRKPKIHDELEKLVKEKKELKAQLNEEFNSEKKINELENDYAMNLKDEFEGLPVHYREMVSFDDENLDKEVLRIYQEEDKRKSNYEATIGGLDKEIGRKAGIQGELEKLEQNKSNLEDEIFSKDKTLNEELLNKFEGLPVHYREMVSFDDENLDKEVLRIYQEEDKRKSNYEATIGGLDKEIGRKAGIQGELEKLEQKKQRLENDCSEQKVTLKKLTDDENLKYDFIKHQNFEMKEKKLVEEINRCERHIGDIEGGIRTLRIDTKDLEEKKEILDELEKKIDKLNFTKDVIEITKNEISNTAKMLREQVMERTRKHVFFILPKITNNKYRDVKITEDFKIKVYSPEKNEYESINSLSGGARDQVLFSLRLAFTNAILGGRSRSKGFALFLDEFLGSFDQSRRDETLKMLRDLKDYFRQIFLISHIDGMEGNVDQVIKTPEI